MAKKGTGSSAVLTPSKSESDGLAKVPVLTDLAKTMDVEYQRMCTKIGTAYAEPLKQFQLESYLRDNHIDVYPLSKVEAFMTAKAHGIPEKRRRDEYGDLKITKTVWEWFPLRATDAGKFKLDVYTKPIPVAVLITVEKIIDDLGAAAKFGVADLKQETRTIPARTDLDPFLCVTAEGCPLYVIERWDEPAFRS